MAVSVGLIVTICGYLCCVIAVSHNDYLLATIGATICLLAGYLTKLKTTFTITGDR